MLYAIWCAILFLFHTVKTHPFGDHHIQRPAWKCSKLNVKMCSVVMSCQLMSTKLGLNYAKVGDLRDFEGVSSILIGCCMLHTVYHVTCVVYCTLCAIDCILCCVMYAVYCVMCCIVCYATHMAGFKPNLSNWAKHQRRQNNGLKTFL